MGYNSGVVTLFNQNTSPTNLLVTQNNAVFNKPSTPVWTSLVGQSISPTLFTSSAISVSFAYGQQIFGSAVASATISFVYGLNIGMSLLSGTVSNAYSLYVSAPTMGSGTIGNLCTAFFGLPSTGTNQGGVGIGTTSPTNALDVSGGVALGDYAGTQTVSFGVVAINNQTASNACLGVRTSSPNYFTDIQGTLQAGAAYGWMPTGIQQKVILSQGFGQSSLGGGSVGTSLGLNSTSLAIAFPQTINSTAFNFFGTGTFDGRYVYFVPSAFSNFSPAGILTRYDTYLPFTATTSYSSFNMLVLNSLATNCYASCFDGRYNYITTWQITFLGALNYVLIRYDTWFPFENASSYSIFDTRNINSNFIGTITITFDGQYIYLGCYQNAIFVRYNTSLPFTAASSYVYFNLSSLNPIIGQKIQALAYDGQFVYINVPCGPTSNYLITYDTSRSFTSSVSYSTFDLSQITGLITNAYAGGAFDGRYIYWSPTGNVFGFASDQALRYDTTLSFTATTSYLYLNLSVISSQAKGFGGAMFDGRYVYFAPGSLGLPGVSVMPRYDTLMAFNITAGFDFINVAAASGNTNANGFLGLAFDGRYLYTGTDSFPLILRIQAYSGPQNSALFASNQASNGFTLGMGVTSPPISPTVSSGTFQIPSLPVGYIQLQGGGNIIRKIPYYN